MGVIFPSRYSQNTGGLKRPPAISRPLGVRVSRLPFHSAQQSHPRFGHAPKPFRSIIALCTLVAGLFATTGASKAKAIEADNPLRKVPTQTLQIKEKTFAERFTELQTAASTGNTPAVLRLISSLYGPILKSRDDSPLRLVAMDWVPNILPKEQADAFEKLVNWREALVRGEENLSQLEPSVLDFLTAMQMMRAGAKKTGHLEAIVKRFDLRKDNDYATYISLMAQGANWKYPIDGVLAWSSIITAVENNQTDTALALLREKVKGTPGFNFNEQMTCMGGFTVGDFIIVAGDSVLLEEALKANRAGALHLDLNHTSDHGVTGLMLAIQQGKIETVRRLFAEVAAGKLALDINLQNPTSQQNALLVAINSTTPEIANLILAYAEQGTFRLNLTQQEKDCAYNPLMMAISKGHWEIAERILKLVEMGKADMDFDQQDRQGRRAEDIARAVGAPDLAAKISQEAKKHSKSVTPITAEDFPAER